MEWKKVSEDLPQEGRLYVVEIKPYGYQTAYWTEGGYFVNDELGTSEEDDYIEIPQKERS